jgi:hypothetical protein
MFSKLNASYFNIRGNVQLPKSNVTYQITKSVLEDIKVNQNIT